MTWSQTRAVGTWSCEVGVVGGQAELRGVEKGMKGNRRQKTGVEPWLRTPRVPGKRSWPPVSPSGPGGSGWRYSGPQRGDSREGSPTWYLRPSGAPL